MSHFPFSYTEIANGVRAARRRASLSQVALAAKAGVSVGTVSLAERGGMLSPTVADRLAAALGITVQEMLSGDVQANVPARKAEVGTSHENERPYGTPWNRQ